MTKEYIEYNTNIEDSFFRYIDKPQIFVTEEKYIGRLNRNKFWFYRTNGNGFSIFCRRCSS